MNHRHRMSTFINSSTSNQTAKHPSCNTVGHLRCSMNEAKENSWTPDPSEPRIRYVANCCVCKNPSQTPWDTLRHTWETWDTSWWDSRTGPGPVGIPSVESIHCFALFRRSSLRVLAMTSDSVDSKMSNWTSLVRRSRPRVEKICTKKIKNETWFQTMQNSWASK